MNIAMKVESEKKYKLGWAKLTLDSSSPECEMKFLVLLKLIN